MITERDIAEKFSVIWKQHFPMLTPNFMRVFNEAQINEINKFSIPMLENVRYDLVSEAAFNLCAEVYTNKINIESFLTNSDNEKKLLKETADTIWKSGYSKKDLNISVDEKNEINKICNNISEFINTVKDGEILFKPKLKGYGVIPDLEADLSIGNTLYEIKTVNRNFKSSDLKQLFIYLALQQTSGKTRWEYGGLYNPRKGTFCKFNIKSLVYNLSGGSSPNETFEKLLNSLGRDIKVDSQF